MNIREGLEDLKNATWTRQKAWIEDDTDQKDLEVFKDFGIFEVFEIFGILENLENFWIFCFWNFLNSSILEFQNFSIWNAKGC